MREIIQTNAAPAPIGPYSQAIRSDGFIFLSGQLPLCPDTGELAGDNIGIQTRQVMKNLAAILQAAGVGLDKVVKTTVFLSNLDDFAEFNRVYEEYFGTVKPSRTTVQVARLPKGALLEVEAIAIA